MANYRKVNVPGHPLVAPGAAQGVIPEHRVILFARIGPGSHPCHDCGKTVTWTPGKHMHPGALIADHRNRDITDNSPDNLVPVCTRCSLRNRSNTIQPGELVVQWAGKTVRAVERECALPSCTVTFVLPPCIPTRYCSRRCAGAARRTHQITH